MWGGGVCGTIPSRPHLVWERCGAGCLWWDARPRSCVQASRPPSRAPCGDPKRQQEADVQGDAESDAAAGAGLALRGDRREGIEGRARHDAVGLGANHGVWNGDPCRASRPEPVDFVLSVGRERRPAATRRAHERSVGPARVDEVALAGPKPEATGFPIDILQCEGASAHARPTGLKGRRADKHFFDGQPDALKWISGHRVHLGDPHRVGRRQEDEVGRPGRQFGRRRRGAGARVRVRSRHDEGDGKAGDDSTHEVRGGLSGRTRRARLRCPPRHRGGRGQASTSADSPGAAGFRCVSSANSSGMSTSRAFEPSNGPTMPASSSWSTSRAARV